MVIGLVELLDEDEYEKKKPSPTFTIQECRFIRDLRFKEGVWPFSAPTGYIKSKEAGTGKTICVPHPEYDSLITWAAKQRAAGYSYEAIASGLRKRGFKMRGGNDPYSQSVWRIMHNPFYSGTMKAFGETIKGI